MVTQNKLIKGDIMSNIFNVKFGDKKYFRIIFLCTFAIGLLVHFYKISNNLLNHDSLFSYYSSQNIIESGRWFLSVACAFSTWYDLPWVSGVFTILLVALTSVVVADILKIKNLSIACISGAVMVSFPPITETLFFGFTADGYALAMLLSAMSVWFATRKKGKALFNNVLSIILLVLTLGIYQAYLSFALLLIICFAIKNTASSSELYIDKKWKFIGKQVTIVAISMVLYYAIWKLLMLFQNVSPTGYQGINMAGFSINTIIIAPLRIIKSMLISILTRNIFRHGISIYAALNILFILVTVCILVLYIVKNKIYKKCSDIIFLIVCVVCIPFAAYFWHFTSTSVEYGPRMLASLNLAVILPLVLCDELNAIRKLKNVVLALIVAMIINNSLIANVCYFYLQQENDVSLSMASEMVTRIHDLGKGNDGKMFVVGSRAKHISIDDKYDTSQILCLSSTLDKDFLYDDTHTMAYLNNTLNCNFVSANEDEKDKILASDKYKEMPEWPKKGSIDIINNIVVIKYPDEV